jgi:hypothetical protein
MVPNKISFPIRIWDIAPIPSQHLNPMKPNPREMKWLLCVLNIFRCGKFADRITAWEA